jgi:hypothetical protein
MINWSISSPKYLRGVLWLAGGELAIFLVLWFFFSNDSPYLVDAEVILHEVLLLILLTAIIASRYRIKKKREFPYVWQLLIGVVIIAVIIGTVIWHEKELPTIVHEILLSNGVTSSATVKNVHLFVAASRGGEIEVTDFARSDRIVMTLYYNGHSMTVAIDRFKDQHPDSYSALYSQILRNEQIAVRYLPSITQIVRPEVEFTDPRNNPYTGW